MPWRARQSAPPKSWSSVKVPVSSPNASDPYAMKPMSCSSQYGRISRLHAAVEHVPAVLHDVDAPHGHARLDLLELEVREADESDLAFAHDVVERLHRLLERGQAVGPVHEVDVDVVGAEVLQALVDRRDDALAAAVAEVRLVPVVHAELGDDDRLVAAPAERLAERALGSAHAVALGGVEAVDAEVERAPDGAHELRLLDVAVAAADLPAAEADGRDLEAGPSERSLLHGRSPRGRVQRHVN